MRLRKIDYGNVLGASGVQGFFGEGYAFHRLLGPLGPNFDDMTFVAKTTTLRARAGNMPLADTYEPLELKPKCIWMNPFSTTALNAVGLSGPGIEKLLEGRRPHLGLFRWQMRYAPFFISFMPVEETAEKRFAEMRGFVKILKPRLRGFSGLPALQINVSCPNTGLDPDKLVSEVRGLLDIASDLNIPLMPKFNVLAPPETVIEMSKHPSYDATCISNTIPFGKYFPEAWWRRRFPNGSPLEKFGGGGLSGKHLFPVVREWMQEALRVGMTKPMNVGGGILKMKDVDELIGAGLRPQIDSIFLGTVAMVRPWRVVGIITHADKALSSASLVSLRSAA